MKIIIDSREQKPYVFKDHETITQKLETGDYSIQGYEDKICIERKSLVDAYGTIGRGRKRFINELERMKNFDLAIIMIESSLHEFLKYPENYNRELQRKCRINHNIDYEKKMMKMNPVSAINSLFAWCIRYKVVPFFCSNRRYGNIAALRFLEKYYKENHNRQQTDTRRTPDNEGG